MEYDAVSGLGRYSERCSDTDCPIVSIPNRVPLERRCAIEQGHVAAASHCRSEPRIVWRGRRFDADEERVAHDLVQPTLPNTSADRLSIDTGAPQR